MSGVHNHQTLHHLRGCTGRTQRNWLCVSAVKKQWTKKILLNCKDLQLFSLTKTTTLHCSIGCSVNSTSFPSFFSKITLKNHQHPTWVLLIPAHCVLQRNNRPQSRKLLLSAVKCTSLSLPKVQNKPPQSCFELFFFLNYTHPGTGFFLASLFPLRYKFIRGHNGSRHSSSSSPTLSLGSFDFPST